MSAIAFGARHPAITADRGDMPHPPRARATHPHPDAQGAATAAGLIARRI